MTSIPFSLSRIAATASPASTGRQWLECPDCGLMQGLPPPQGGLDRTCARCEAPFGRGCISFSGLLAISSTSVIMLMVAYALPLLGIHIEGRENTVSIFQATTGLFQQNNSLMGSFVFMLSVFFPIAHLTTQTAVMFFLWNGQHPAFLARLNLWSERMRPWAMLDVMLLGLFITISKLRDVSDVRILPGLWALAALVALFFAFGLTADRQKIWDSIKAPPACGPAPERGHWVGCHACNLLHRSNAAYDGHPARCERCNTPLYPRKPDSIARTWALVIAGYILYVPANLLPVMTVVNFGHEQPTTIMHGVRELWNGKDWPYAFLVFLASIIIPVFKLLGLTAFLLTFHLRSRGYLSQGTRYYRLFEKIGRWSVLDVYVAALLGALVTFGNIATIEPGPGLMPFAAVVVLTMLAVEAFDPRLMWDAAGGENA